MLSDVPFPYVISILTIIFAPLITLWVARMNSKSDLILDDRQAFRAQQDRFQKEIREELHRYREDNDKLRTQIADLDTQLRSVRIENVLLQQENISLTANIARLEEEIFRLEERLSSYERED